jgi:hypothetical protein
MPQCKRTGPCANLAERFLLPMLHRTSNALYVGTALAAVISTKMCEADKVPDFPLGKRPNARTELHS